MIVSDAFGHFLSCCRAERHVSDSSLHKYRDCFSAWIAPWFGQQEVGTITRLKILDLRQAMMNRQLSVARQYGVTMCLKSLLTFCRTARPYPVSIQRTHPTQAQGTTSVNGTNPQGAVHPQTAEHSSGTNSGETAQAKIARAMSAGPAEVAK